MTSLDHLSVAAFASDDCTRELIQCAEGNNQWVAFFEEHNPFPPCTACVVEGVEDSCVVEKYTVGCQACYASLDRCSILDDHCIQTLVSRFGNTVQQAKEHLHLLSEVQSYFKGINAERKVSSWDEINDIERRARAGGDELSSAMTDLRVLHLKLELDLLDQRLTAKSWGDTLMEISNRAMEAIDEVKEDRSDDFEKAVKDVARMASNALDAESSVPGLDD
ncbi:hypothetical protein BKA70DRAFT_1242303 [Coprinopsis sp. MPI-PUGE-AT-0042]|nr:hypothetical protein BKA70DRAFT_1242303 [Coprinopsis sp. MPI-PUGE-AT-0042]